MRFRDRRHAGQKLAEALEEYQGGSAVVYALPRGGVVLGKIVAEALGAPLDLLIPRKIGHPFNPEYAVAAVTEAGEVVQEQAQFADIDEVWFAQEVARQREEARRRRETYLVGRARADTAGKTAIIVDDGIATGLTMKAAILDLQTHHPSSIVVAVPVAPLEAVRELEQMVDRVVTLETPEVFLGAIGSYYDEFNQVSDEEVVALLSL